MVKNPLCKADVWYLVGELRSPTLPNKSIKKKKKDRMDEAGQTGVTYVTSHCPVWGLALMWIIFKVFTESVTILLLFCLLAFWQEAWEILAPRPGIEPAPPALEGEILTTGPPGNPALNINSFYTSVKCSLFSLFFSSYLSVAALRP